MKTSGDVAMNKTAIKKLCHLGTEQADCRHPLPCRIDGHYRKGHCRPSAPEYAGCPVLRYWRSGAYLVAGEAIKQRRQLVEVIRDKEKDSDYRTAYQYVMGGGCLYMVQPPDRCAVHGGQRLSAQPCARVYG